MMFDRLPTLALVSDPTKYASATCFLRHPSEPAGVSASPKQEQGLMKPDKQVKHGRTRDREGVCISFQNTSEEQTQQSTLLLDSAGNLSNVSKASNASNASAEADKVQPSVQFSQSSF